MTPSRAQAKRATAPAGRILAIGSGKGGVGKTWFSITLAHALARAEQRALLFDADLGLANVDIQLGLLPKRDLGDVVNQRITLGDAAMRFEAGHFDIVPGRSGSLGMATLGPDRRADLVRQIRGLTARYQWIILDLSAGIDDAVSSLAATATTCLVLCTDEPTSLTDAYAFIKLMRRRQAATAIQIVVNQASSREAGQRTFETLRRSCETFLNFAPELLGVVRSDPRVADAIRHQTSLLTRHPASNAAADAESIALRLLSQP
ncbi:MAG: MinD/ParA family protein [Alphaproteobacteria bacterium]